MTEEITYTQARTIVTGTVDQYMRLSKSVFDVVVLDVIVEHNHAREVRASIYLDKAQLLELADAAFQAVQGARDDQDGHWKDQQVREWQDDNRRAKASSDSPS